jgi:hypothetical protein
MTTPTPKSDAEIALMAARADLTSIVLHVEQMRNALIARSLEFQETQNSLAAIDKISVLEGADDLIFKKNATTIARLLNETVDKLSRISACADCLDHDINQLDFGPIPKLGLAAASLV